ncbi:hypothetical protein NKG05_17555 [Oerskovia sp. M15]
MAWHYGDPTGEQRALETGGAVVDLSHYGVVRVKGPDRLTWLHSITSQNLLGLAPRTSTELLVLSPQGHIEHAAGVVDDGESTWLVTEGSHAPTFAAWLDRMKFSLRVEITDMTDDIAVLGEPRDAEGAESEPVTWRDPWPRTAREGRATARRTTSTRHPPPVAAGAGPRAELLDAVAAREAAAGGWPVRGRARRCGSRHGVLASRPRRTTAPSRTSSTGSAPRCT